MTTSNVASSTEMQTVIFLLPSLRTSGGVREAVRLARDLQAKGVPVRIVSMWSHPAAETVDDIPVAFLLPTMATKAMAWKDLVQIALRFRAYLRSLKLEAGKRNYSVFGTHFSTLPFLYFVSRARRYVFIQDTEWEFVGGGVAQKALRRVIVFFYRSATLIAANSYLTGQFKALGLIVSGEASIWASSAFYSSDPSSKERSVDFAMVLRRGAHKRLDLYIDLLLRIRSAGRMRTACITPDEAIAGEVAGIADIVLLRPSLEEMKALYSDAKVFLLLSEHEGFALPPLEAMGSGCVPVCRDCGGVSAYMNGELTQNLLPLTAGIEEIESFAIAAALDAPQREYLSDIARKAFHDGLEDAEAMRSACLDALAETFAERS